MKKRILALLLCFGLLLSDANLPVLASTFDRQEIKTVTGESGTVEGNDEDNSWEENRDGKERSSLSLLYEANGDNVTGMPESSTYQYAQSVTISEVKPHREGFVFNGWSSEPDGYGDFYAGGETFQITQDLTLYAVWGGEDRGDAIAIEPIETEAVHDEEKGVVRNVASGATDVVLKKIRNLPYTYDVQAFTGKFFKANLTPTDSNGKKNTVTAYAEGIYTCMAYANELFYYLFGSNFAKSYGSNGVKKTGKVTVQPGVNEVGNIQRVNYSSDAQYKAEVKKLLALAKPGDIIAATDGTYFHFMIFMYTDDEDKDGEIDCFYTAEGNYDSKNHIVIEYKRSINYLVTRKKVAMSLYHNEKYDPYFNYCTHYDNNQDGQCDNTACNAWMPNQEEGVTPADGVGIYQTIDNDVAFRPYPYQGAGRIQGTSGTIPINTEVKVTGAVKNSFGHIWFTVEFGGQTGYIYPARLKYKRALPQPVPQVTVSNLAVPTNHVEGTSFKIGGEITASECKITGVQAWFVNATGNKIYEISKVSYNKRSLLLRGSTVDNRLKFNNLSPGQYKYVIYVTTDTSKTAIAESNWFIVVGKNSPKAQSIPAAPTLSAPAPFIGGNTYTISQSTNGVELWYSLDNGANYSKAQGNSVTVQITNTATIKAYSGTIANEQTWSVQVKQVNAPEIYSTPNASGSTVQIAADSGSNVYYQIGNGQFVPYTGAFTVTSGCTVTAYAEKSGCITSNRSSQNILVYSPDTPSITRDTAEHIADGDVISVHWGADAKAGSYNVNIYKDGQLWKTEETSNCQYTFLTEGVATYKVTVSARNAVGSSAVSNAVTAVTHAPSTVVFKDYDGTVLSTQNVKYGGSAVKPATPVRRGYTFAGWNGGYNNVVQDVTITADYEINVYTVKFYDVDGSTPLGTQEIIFDEAIDSETMKTKVSISNGGRIFTGWYIFYAKEKDSHLDLDHIDSDMNVRAVTSWENENLPVYIDNVSATISYGATSNVFNGYHVTCDYSTTEAKDMKAKIIVTLLSKADDGVYKMVSTKVDTIHLKADSSNYSWSGDITCNGSNKADRVEVSVVSIEGTDRTGGLLAEAKFCDIEASASAFWSDWMTAEQLAAKGHNVSETDVESKVQYRDRSNYQDRQSSGSAVAPTGYTLLSDNSYWGGWSGWVDYYIGGSSTRQVETTTERVSSGYTQYRYGAWRNANNNRHFCKETGKANKGGTWYTTYTGWSTTQYTPDKSMTWGYCPTTSHSHVGYNQYTNGKYYWTHYTINGSSYYWEETQWVDTSYDRTLYRYRDYVSSYTYYKWIDGTWGDWKDEVLTDYDLSDRSYEVQMQTVYRYKMYDASLLTTDTSGTVRTVKGSLNDSALSGRKATILVYKSLNTDPTESQLEYVGQTTLDEDGAYNFRFITKEEPSADTYDFIVALAVEGSDSLVNVDVIRYERSSYTVTFAADDTVVDTQEIYEGESAKVPDAPEKEGYVFIGWSKNTTNVTKNITAVAKYKPQSYCVAFVDYLNQSCTLTRADYDSNVTIPEELLNREYEGYVFGGWDLSEHPVVDGDIVIAAVWTPVEYTVKFYDADNKVLESQKVAYGQAAVPPKNIKDTEDKNFLGWSDDFEWWNVKSDIDVYPIMAYNKTVAAISSNVSYYEEGLSEEVELQAEDDAVIYFTLDGTMPDPEAAVKVAVADYVIPEATSIVDEDEDDYVGTTYIYTEPIPIAVSADVTAIACKDGYEDSSVFYHTFEYTEEIANETDYGAVVDLNTHEVTVENSDIITLDIALNKSIPLAGTMIMVEADPKVFAPLYNAETEDIALYPGALNEGNGEVYFEGYDEKKGLLLLWLGNNSVDETGSLFKLDLYVGDIEKAGTYPIKVKYATAYTYDDDFCPVRLENAIDFTISKNGNRVVNKAGLVVSEVEDQIYTGSAIKPEITIWDNDAILTEGIDYTVAYKNNTNVNDGADINKEPHIIIKGKGNYSDQIDIYFNILPADITKTEFTCDEEMYAAYTGKAQKPMPVLKRGTKKLSAKKDYTVAYYDAGGQTVVPVDRGEYVIRVAGQGNYTGVVEVPFTITESVLLNKAKISAIAVQEYTGDAIEPEPVVKMGTEILTRDVDYIVDYRNNIDAGTATLIVKGIGKYSGIKQTNFKIKGVLLSKVSVTKIENVSYTGKEIVQKGTLRYNGENLVENRDYIVSCKNNKNVGTAIITYTGKGKYAGTVKKTFKIVAKDLQAEEEDFQVTFYGSNGETFDSGKIAVPYTKGGVTPKIKVVDVKTGNVLKEKTDYTISCKNNKAITSGSDATLTITGKKNYKGKIIREFAITKSDLSALNIVAVDKKYSSKPGGYKSLPIVKDSNGKVLTAGVDYDKNIVYSYLEDTIINNNVTRAAGENVQSEDIVPIGTVIQMRIVGNGNYAGSSVTADYRIVKNVINGARVIVQDQMYTGSEIVLNPDNDEIRVISNGKKLVCGEDYIIAGYENNIDKGKATVIIKGIGDYGGVKSVNFTIGTRKIFWWIF